MTTANSPKGASDNTLAGAQVMMNHAAGKQPTKSIVPLMNASQSHTISPHQLREQLRQTKSQLSNVDALDSTMHSYYNMQSVDLANRTLNLMNAEQTGLSFQGRN